MCGSRKTFFVDEEVCGHYDHALAAQVAAAGHLDVSGRRPSQEHLAMYGMLRCSASYAAAQAGDRDRAGDLLGEADITAGRLDDPERARALAANLNRVAIEHLYGGAASFERNRHLIIPRLLDGPVSIERWTGHRLELALASKLLVRRVLSTEAVTNLVHVEITTALHAANILKAAEIPPSLADDSWTSRRRSST